MVLINKVSFVSVAVGFVGRSGVFLLFSIKFYDCFFS